MGNSEVKPLCTTPSQNILMQQIEDHELCINSMDMSDDGNILATGGDDKTVRLYKVTTDSVELAATLSGHKGPITSLVITDSYLLTASKDRSVRKWDLATSDLTFAIDAHSGPVNIVQHVHQIDAILTCSTDSTIKMFDYHNALPLHRFAGHTLSVSCVTYVPANWFDGDVENLMNKSGPKRITNKNFQKGVVISGSADKTVKSWSVNSDRVLNTFEGHEGAITCLDVDPSNKILLTGAADKTLRTWKLIGGQSLRIFHGHEAPVTCMKAMKKVVFSGSGDYTVRSWATEFGDCMKVFAGHDKSVNSICVYEGVMFTACGDHMVRAYCTRTGKLIRVFEGHKSSVISVRALGDRLFSTDFSGKLLIWHLAEVYLYVQK